MSVAVRVLVYEGDPSWIEMTLGRGKVPMTGLLEPGPVGRIYSATLMLEEAEEMILPKPLIESTKSLVNVVKGQMQ
jgi:hypothetical protein